ncbi:MAG: hypothetical protein ABIS14_10570, partial [Sphingomonas sp.]
MAQTVVTNPSGGGSITRNGGAAPSVTDQTATGGGVRVYDITGNTPITVSGVTINQSVTGPTANALALEGSTAGSNNIGVTFSGTNAITSSVANGAALALTSNATSNAVINAATTLQGKYGIDVIAGGASILNAGTIKGTVNAAIYAAGGGTITNATGGAITGGAGVGAVNLNGGGTFNNYGSVDSFGAAGSGASGVSSTGGDTFVNLYAGSVTGTVALGSGNDTLTIYTGRGTADVATTDTASGITLQSAGTKFMTNVGAIDLGGGNNTLVLAGNGDGTAAKGAAGSYQIGNASNVSVLHKTGSGIWTLNGAAGASMAGATINAGDGGVPGSGGTLIFANTTGLTGVINVNGTVIRALGAGAFGTGTINAIDPTIQYGSTGTYANNIVLQSVDTANDPTVLQTFGLGITATLSGSITQAGSANQPLVFKSTDTSGNPLAGTFILTGNGSWLGTTTISAL